MLREGQRLFAYPFKGYWKDVGTGESLLEANLDLLNDPIPIDLVSKNWRIYARNPGLPPHYCAPGSSVSNAMITEGCEVFGSVSHSVLFADVRIEPEAKVLDSVIMPQAVIGQGATVSRSIIAEGAVIGPGCAIGGAEGGIAVVGQGARVKAGTVVLPGEQYANKPKKN
jgi:glucose-1-phosphate adenylyltransferase